MKNETKMSAEKVVKQPKPKLMNIKLEKLLPFENHPFIVDNIDETETFPSHAQARRMRVAFEEGKLDYNAVTEIMNELKPNQVEKLKIPMDDIRKYVPKSMTPAEMQAYLLKLVKQDYDRQHNRDAR